MRPNPTAVLVIALAVLAIIVAYKGTQENFVAAILGHPPADSNTGSSSGGSSSGSGLLNPSGQKPLSNPFNPLNLPAVPGTLANPGGLSGALKAFGL